MMPSNSGRRIAVVVIYLTYAALVGVLSMSTFLTASQLGIVPPGVLVGLDALLVGLLAGLVTWLWISKRDPEGDIRLDLIRQQVAGIAAERLEEEAVRAQAEAGVQPAELLPVGMALMSLIISMPMGLIEGVAQKSPSGARFSVQLVWLFSQMAILFFLVFSGQRAVQSRAAKERVARLELIKKRLH